MNLVHGHRVWGVEAIKRWGKSRLNPDEKERWVEATQSVVESWVADMEATLRGNLA